MIDINLLEWMMMAQRTSQQVLIIYHCEIILDWPKIVL
jgi:hypothetical protein